MSEVQQATEQFAVAVARLRRAERAAELGWCKVDRLFAGIRNRLAGAMLSADTDAIDELQAALAAEDYSTARDIAAELAIGFDHVQVQDA